MLLRSVDQPLKTIGLEAFARDGDVEGTDKGRTRRGVLRVDRCLKNPSRFLRRCVIHHKLCHYSLERRKNATESAEDATCC